MTTDPEETVEPTTGSGQVVELEDLGFDRGGHLLVAHALRRLPTGHEIEVRGSDPSLRADLGAWCRVQGHSVAWDTPEEDDPLVARVTRGDRDLRRLAGAERAGDPSPSGVVERAPRSWGLAARGALVEQGGPPADFDLDDRDLVWTEVAPRLYANAAAAQWDPETAIDWDAEVDLPPEIEEAVVQVMTYLVENEQAALNVPARFLARIHPHYREVVQFLAIQTADEARHVEVFTRRALLSGGPLGVSGSGGRASLQTLLEEPDFTLAHFLLSVLGEGSFLELLAFIERHGPDPVTRRVAELAFRDEARHVTFGMAHMLHRVDVEPGLRDRLRRAIEQRHDQLVDTAGLNAEVFDALVLLAAGAWTPEAVAEGYAAVQQLQEDMDQGRRRRLRRLGFSAREAADLSALHTRNFM